jgi:hypothetical protein
MGKRLDAFHLKTLRPDAGKRMEEANPGGKGAVRDAFP